MSKIDRLIDGLPPRERAAIIAYQEALRHRRDWHRAILDALAAADAVCTGGTTEKVETALRSIVEITGQTHQGQDRAYTALSKIDEIVREALR